MKVLLLLVLLISGCGSTKPKALNDPYCTSYGRPLSQFCKFSSYPELCQNNYSKVDQQMLDKLNYICNGYRITKITVSPDYQIYVYQVGMPYVTSGIIEHFPFDATNCNKQYGTIDDTCMR